MSIGLRSTIVLLLLLVGVALESLFATSARAQDITLPIVSITTPVADSTVAGPLIVVANASDNVGVTQVNFYLDNILKDTDLIPPNAYTLNLTLVRNGVYTITAKAYDAAGNVGTSAPVSINVKNAFRAPTNLLVTTTTKSSVSLSWLPSIENTGEAAAYTIFRNGIQIATTSALSFINSGLTPATTYQYYVMGYDGGGNTSNNSNIVFATTQAKILFGLSMSETLLGLNTSTLNADLSQLSSLGVTWIRFDIAWKDVQPNSNSNYNWSFIDPFVASAAAHHIQLLALLDGTPSWAATPACNATGIKCPPADNGQYAAFVKAVVARYAPQGITHWEIWNEPNLGSQWGGTASAAGYTQLLEAVSTAIKSQSPGSIVITGGMSPSPGTTYNVAPVSFLSQLYADGAGPYFDAVGMHPYSYPAMPSLYKPWSAWQQMFATNPSLRSVMIANGDAGKQIWITEYGAPTGGPGNVESSTTDTVLTGGLDHVTEAVQAAMLSDALTSAASYPWASTVFWYSYQDLGTSQTSNQNFFGLLRYDGSTKPAYQTLENLLST